MTQIVEADSEESAIEIAVKDSCLTCFCGNGASNRLVGVTKGGIEPCEGPLELGPFNIEVSEV